jgi:hypothetical protein
MNFYGFTDFFYTDLRILRIYGFFLHGFTDFTDLWIFFTRIYGLFHVFDFDFF